MQKNYELLYIVHPDLEGSTDKVTEKVTGFITKTGGQVTAHEDWGKRKLAYPIAKNAFGVYTLMNFKTEPTKLHEVERDLRLSEEIMRSMVVVVPDVKEVTPRVKKETPEVKTEKVEVPASIIVSDEKSAKKAVAKKAVAKKEEKTNVIDKKASVSAKAITDKPAKKAAKTDESAVAEAMSDKKAEAARLKKLDEKLDELLK